MFIIQDPTITRLLRKAEVSNLEIIAYELIIYKSYSQVPEWRLTLDLSS